MSTLVVPDPSEDPEPWPTLGPEVCDFISDLLVHGPGDIRGEPARLDDETRALIFAAYEVFPKGHPQEGRRRYKRAAWSLRKGLAKTEKAAWIAIVEAHPEGPVRCDGWRKQGGAWVPVGRPISDPYIPMVAYTEEQTEDLAYAAVKSIIEESAVAGDFDTGFERITRRDGTGKIVALAGSPGARDGARTTFQHFDEPHRMTTPQLLRAHETMTANVPKRYASDAWSLETTTAYQPGENSVAEKTHKYAKKVQAGKAKDRTLFFFHRQASERHDLTTDKGLRAAIKEATGPEAMVWTDVDAIVSLYHQALQKTYFQRVWLNQIVSSSDAFTTQELWSAAEAGRARPEQGRPVALGFDGSRFRDATALRGCDLRSGRLFTVGIWERPDPDVPWEVPRDEVHERVHYAFKTWRVERMYADPPDWDSDIADWHGQYGSAVMAFYTRSERRMSDALKEFHRALTSGDVKHDGDPTAEQHHLNARLRLRIPAGTEDDPDKHVWKIRSPNPGVALIDCCVTDVLAWAARVDAVAAGANLEPTDKTLWTF